MHFVGVPLTIVFTAVRPSIDTDSMDVIFEKVSSVGATIGPKELTLTVLFTVFVLAFIAGVVWPDFFALTVLFVLEPITFVTCTISVIVLSETVRLVIFPFSIIDVSISVD
jgi:hypothetical protein